MDDRETSVDDALRDVLDLWPREVRERALAADRVLMGRVPGMTREIGPDGKMVGYMLGPGYKGTLFTILLSRSGVKIGFSHGATLPDPAGMLGGSGKVHRTFPVGSVDDVDNPALLKLVDAAHNAWRTRNAS
jgi:hypothetical protein